VQIEYDVVHLRTSLVQLFALLQLNFEVVQIIELKRFGDAPNGYPFAALPGSPPTRLTAVPDKWVRPTRRLADLSVGPTDLVGSPHDLLKTFQKIP
jgi:hypothetical protein